MDCILCGSGSSHFLADGTLGDQYLHCLQCDFRFLNPRDRLPPAEEKARYEQHQNDVTDVRYQNFVQPLVDAVAARKAPPAQGLDFGAGTAPVLGQQLEKAGYAMNYYDSYFIPNPQVLSGRYDFIVACEVLEHLYDPRTEIRAMGGRLKPGGFFAAMTLLYDPKIDFRSWYYRRDPTHVGFFSKQSLEWIAQDAGFGRVAILAPRIVVFELHPTE